MTWHAGGCCGHSLEHMRSLSHQFAMEHVILPELPLTLHGPIQIKPSNSSRNSKFSFQDHTKRNEHSGPGDYPVVAGGRMNRSMKLAQCASQYLLLLSSADSLSSKLFLCRRHLSPVCGTWGTEATGSSWLRVEVRKSALGS